MRNSNACGRISRSVKLRNAFKHNESETHKSWKPLLITIFVPGGSLKCFVRLHFGLCRE